MKKQDNKKGFEISSNNGFHITFPSGLTLSTQFGAGSYITNRPSFGDKAYGASDDCEIAIWDATGDWKTRDVLGPDIGDDVKGYVTVADWSDIVSKCANYR